MEIPPVEVWHQGRWRVSNRRAFFEPEDIEPIRLNVPEDLPDEEAREQVPRLLVFQRWILLTLLVLQAQVDELDVRRFWKVIQRRVRTHRNRGRPDVAWSLRKDLNILRRFRPQHIQFIRRSLESVEERAWIPKFSVVQPSGARREIERARADPSLRLSDRDLEVARSSGGSSSSL